jgi:thiamine biosynthesis lipoprotein
MKLTKSLILIIIILFVLTIPNCRKPQTPFETTNIIMGTVVSQKVFGNNGKAAAEEAIEKIRSLERMLSFFQQGSEVSRLNNSAGKDKVNLSTETYFLLSKSTEYSRLSDGAFNIMVGPLVKKWKVTGENPQIPSPSEIRSLLSLIDYRDLILNNNESSARLSKKGQMVDLGGIAKGFAADEVLKIYKKHGIKSAILDIGGNVSVLGFKPDGSKWAIGLQDPAKQRGEYLCRINLHDRSFSTSGGYERYFKKNGKIYHHIVDPKTGYPSKSDLLSATIIGETSVDTDTLSTAVFILGLKKGLNLLKKTANEAVLITVDNKIHSTEGLKDMIECDTSVIYH